MDTLVNRTLGRSHNLFEFLVLQKTETYCPCRDSKLGLCKL